MNWFITEIVQWQTWQSFTFSILLPHDAWFITLLFCWLSECCRHPHFPVSLYSFSLLFFLPSYVFSNFRIFLLFTLYLWFVYFLYFLKRLAILSKAVQFNLEEVKECRPKVKELERRYEQLTKDNYDLKESVRLSVRMAAFTLLRYCRGRIGLKLNKQARQTFFRGPRGYIEGRRIGDAKWKAQTVIRWIIINGTTELGWKWEVTSHWVGDKSYGLNSYLFIFFISFFLYLLWFTHKLYLVH